MGNKSSTSANVAATSTEGQVGDNGDATSVNNSGVFLSNELQCKWYWLANVHIKQHQHLTNCHNLHSETYAAEIVNAFQSEELKTQWEKLQAGIITNHEKRVSKAEARSATVEKELTRWRKDNEAVQSALDQKIDELKAKFADASVAIAYDVGKLEEKIGSSPKFGGNEACSDIRITLANCYKYTDDIRSCDEIVKAMETCAKQTIMA